MYIYTRRIYNHPPQGFETINVEYPSGGTSEVLQATKLLEIKKNDMPITFNPSAPAATACTIDLAAGPDGRTPEALPALVRGLGPLSFQPRVQLKIVRLPKSFFLYSPHPANRPSHQPQLELWLVGEMHTCSPKILFGEDAVQYT